jgi:hybrid cluster-associated redox disulfide protein
MRDVSQTVRADSVVDDVMRTWPSTIRAFLDFHMGCVGCPVGPFHTIRESCRAHGIDTEAFLAAVETMRRRSL